MCGIFCCICAKMQTIPNWSETVELLSRRGPDFKSELCAANNSHDFRFMSSVLWLQGSNIVRQPYETEAGILMFNGDIYYGTSPKESESDVEYLSRQLAIRKDEDLVEFIYNLNGPFAFVYFDKRLNRLYFGRDKFGRKSLLFAYDSSSIWIGSCVRKMTGFEFIEVPAIGLFTIEFSETIKKPLNVTVNVWHSNQDFVNEKLHEFQTISGFDVIVSPKIIEDLRWEIDFNCKIDYLLLDSNSFDNLLTLNSEWSKNTVCLVNLLRESVRTRANYQPDRCIDCTRLENENGKCSHCSIGILFSGGLDCTILALLFDEYIDRKKPIDLLNVAFEKQSNDLYETPDRLTARQSLRELKRLRPDREWRLFEINVSKCDLRNMLDEHVKYLIYPRQTILDESLGCALWFAANRSFCKSSCRIIISGIGADELFGGYSRHRRAFANGNLPQNWSKLDQELQTTWIQIAERNLARDDRVISDSGRQLRMPFLDENLVRFVQLLAPWQKCYPKTNNIGFGDKLLLRLAAHHLNLTATARLAKRALQFGSRIANKHENGNEISPRMTFS